MASSIWPELTTIRQPIAEMARLAVRMLADAVRQPQSGQVLTGSVIQLPFALIRRTSDVPPL